MKTAYRLFTTYPLVTIVSLLITGGVALTPQAGAQVISACVNNSSGTIHIVAPGTVCGSNHTLLTWAIHGITGYQIVTHQVFLNGGQSTNVHVDCPEGKKVLGGGFDIETPDFVKIFSSEPSDGAGNITDHGWNVFARNDDTRVRQVTVSAVCAVLE
jgi:hypothetical protein